MEVRTMKSTLRVCWNIKYHPPLCKIINMYWMMTMNLKKKDEDKGNAENEEEFEILIHPDLPIVIERYSFKNRIKQPARRTFSF